VETVRPALCVRQRARRAQPGVDPTRAPHALLWAAWNAAAHSARLALSPAWSATSPWPFARRPLLLAVACGRGLGGGGSAARPGHARSWPGQRRPSGGW